MQNKNSYTKKSTRIFAFLMCLILLLNIGCSYAVTTSGEKKAERDIKKWTTNYTGIYILDWISNYFARQSEEEEKGSFTVEEHPLEADAFRVTNINAKNDFLKDWYFEFKLSDNAKAGAYQVSVFYRDMLGNQTFLKYKLGREAEKGLFRVDDENTVPLCVTQSADSYGGLPKVEDIVGSKKDTSINVILEKDYIYGIHFDNITKSLTKNRPITIVVKDITPNQGGQEIFYSNIPSGYISMRCALENDNGRRAPADSEFKTVMIDQEVIDYYLRLWGFKRKATDSVESLPVESAAAAIIIFFGEIILYFGEKFLSVDNLTLDNLIFNRLGGKADPVIDLRGLGGILDTNDEDVQGVLGNPTVIEAISTVYSGLRYVAIIVYLISLLYLGVKTLMAVGTPNEAKTKKFIQYWITGAIILLIVPYFLPAIPYITNKLVEALSPYSDAAGEFSVTYIARYLGQNYLGEDADVKETRKQLEKRLDRLYQLSYKKQAENFVPMSPDDINSTLNEVLNEIKSSPYYAKDGYNVETKVKSIFKEIIKYINQNCDKWTEEADAKVDEMISSVYDYVYGRNTLTAISNEKLNDIFTGIYVSGSGNGLYAKINASSLFAKLRDQKGAMSLHGNSYYERTKEYLQKLGIDTTKFENYAEDFQNMCEYRGQTAGDAELALREFVEEYKDSAVAYEIETLQKMQNQLIDDPMVALKNLAKSQGRMVYAIAWCILLFQLFAMIFMYYKRLFVVILLVCVFPLVVAMYVIDKMGDGQAQSLQSWFKEFFANSAIQFLHAAIYVMLVNIGIKICAEDPTTNWPFLIMCVTFLFPAEKLLRGIVGLQSNTLEGLKLNIVGSLVAAKSIGRSGVALGKGVGNVAKGGVASMKNFHQGAVKAGMGGVGGHLKYGASKLSPHALGESLRESFRKDEEEAKEKKKDKQNKKQNKHDSRTRRQDLRNQEIQNSRALDKSNRTARDKLNVARGAVNDTMNSVKDTVSNSAIGRGAKAIGKGAKAVGNVANKVSNSKLGRVSKYAGRKLKKGAGKAMKGYSKLAKVTAAGVKAMDTMGSSGIGTAMADFGMLTSDLTGAKKRDPNAPITDGTNPNGIKPSSGGFASSVSRALGRDRSAEASENETPRDSTEIPSEAPTAPSREEPIPEFTPEELSGEAGEGAEETGVDFATESGGGSGGTETSSRVDTTFTDEGVSFSGTGSLDDDSSSDSDFDDIDDFEDKDKDK